MQDSICWYLTIDSINGNEFPDFDGTMWERIVSRSIGVPWVRSMGKFDIAHEGIAWSCKTKLKSSFGDPRIIGYKMSQCGKRFAQDDDIDGLTRDVVRFHNENVDKVLETHDEFRSIMCVRDRKRQRYYVYEKHMPKFDVADYDWAAADSAKVASNGTVLIEGTHKESNRKELAISLLDNRLYHWDEIPGEKLVFEAEIKSVDCISSIIQASGSLVHVVNAPIADLDTQPRKKASVNDAFEF